MKPALSLLQKNRQSKVILSGHTDAVGNEKSNQQLSVMRAKVVARYFIEHQIDASRITIKGFGEIEPNSNNEYFSGRMGNRRVEVLVLSESLNR